MRLTSFTAATVAVMAGSALLVASPGASSADPTRSSAYGVSVNGGGQAVVPPSPTVESTDGSEQSTGGSIPPEAAPLLAGGVLELTAGDDKASVKVTDLEIGDVGSQVPSELTDQLEQLQAGCEQLPDLPEGEVPDTFGELPIPVPAPSAEDFGDFCERLGGEFTTLASLDTLQVECDGDSGKVTVLGASLLGAPLPTEDLENVDPNTKLFPDNPLLDVTLNRQTEGPRGAFTVDGLVISLGGGQAEAVVASTTCGEGIPQGAARNSGGEAPTAPAPTPQQGSAPVTG